MPLWAAWEFKQGRAGGLKRFLDETKEVSQSSGSGLPVGTAFTCVGGGVCRTCRIDALGSLPKVMVDSPEGGAMNL